MVSIIYIIGYNPELDKSDPWLERAFNSTEDIYLHSLISEAIEEKYPELYFHITQERGVEIMRFDDLSGLEFNKVISCVRQIILNDQNLEVLKKGANLWDKCIEPLITLDQRSKNKWVG